MSEDLIKSAIEEYETEIDNYLAKIAEIKGKIAVLNEVLSKGGSKRKASVVKEVIESAHEITTQSQQIADYGRLFRGYDATRYPKKNDKYLYVMEKLQKATKEEFFNAFKYLHPETPDTEVVALLRQGNQVFSAKNIVEAVKDPDITDQRSSVIVFKGFATPPNKTTKAKGRRY